MLILLWLAGSLSPLWADNSFDVAKSLADNGQFVAARQAFLDYITIHPQAADVTEARVQSVLCLFHGGDCSVYKTEAESLLAVEPAPSQEQKESLTYYLALVPYRQGDWVQARTALGQFIASHPNALHLVQAQCYAALTLINTGDYVAFETQAKRIIDQPAGLPAVQLAELRYHLAMVPFYTAHWAEAHQSLMQYATENTSSSQRVLARYHAAMTLFYQKLYADFQKEGLSFFADFPDAPDDNRQCLSYHLAILPVEQRDWAKGRESLQQFLTRFPAGKYASWAKANAAQCLYESGQYETFQQEANAVLQQSPNEPNIDFLRYLLAMVPFNRGQWAQASIDLKDYAEAHPDTDLGSWAEYHRLLALRRKGDYDAFIPLAEAFLTQHPKAIPDQVTTLRFEKALAVYGQNRFTAAREALGEFCNDSSDTTRAVWAQCVAAQALFHMGDLAQFKKEATAVLAAHPQDASQHVVDLNLYLAMAATRQQHWQEGIDLLNKYLSAGQMTNVTGAAARLELGRALLQLSGEMRAEKKDTLAISLERSGKAKLTEMRAFADQVLPVETDPGQRQQIELWAMESYYFEGDVVHLLDAAQKIKGKYAPPTRAWALGMQWYGIAQTMTTPQNLQAAAEAFEAILTANVSDDLLADHIPTNAAYWRVAVAQMQGDKTSARHYLEIIKNQMPQGAVRQRALTDLGWLLDDVPDPQ